MLAQDILHQVIEHGSVDKIVMRASRTAGDMLSSDESDSSASAPACGSAADIRRRDLEAQQEHNAQSKRTRTALRGRWLAEEHNMARGDRESKIYQQIDEMHAEIRRPKEKANGGISIPTQYSAQARVCSSGGRHG